MTSNEEIAFPTLAPERIERMRTCGNVRATREGEVLFREGDRDFDFFVVLSGAVEIVASGSPRPEPVTVHRAGGFTGDVDMLTGRGALVSARVVEGGEVLAVPADGLRRIVRDVPDVGETLLRAFLMRRTLLLDEGYEGVKIIGSRFSPDAHRLRDFATRNTIPFTWLDVESDPAAERLLQEFGVGPDETPVVLGRDGHLLRNPSLADFGSCVGLDSRVDPDDLHDLVVVGAGPAGLAAAVYAASEGLRTFAVDGMAVGGQAGTSTRIENYLGFPTGISGSDLMSNAMLQAQKFGVRLSVPRTATALRLEPGRRVVVLDDGSEVAARCVLVASGAEYRTLDVPGLEAFHGAGVYYAATASEARLCRGEEVVVVGGGNSAGQAIVYLAGVARRVHVLLRGGDLGASMSRYLVDRIERTANIAVHPRRVVASVEGNGHLESVRTTDPAGGAPRTLGASALFVFIGAVPHTGWMRECVRLDARGFVLTGRSLVEDAPGRDGWAGVGRAPFLLETSLPGVFAAGDVRSGSVKRVSSAVGEGAMAVSFIHQHLAARA